MNELNKSRFKYYYYLHRDLCLQIHSETLTE